jgi:hypothetical protein
MEKLDPHLDILRSDIVEPIVMEFKILILLPIVTLLKILKLEPNLAYILKLTVLPKLV